jgi:MoaA/NifB/PqqE/SkfB family radical SAM enzyme
MSLPLFFSPTFDWIQVEITTYCNAACIYCPRTIYKNSWRDRHLPLDLFLKIKSAFPKTKHLHLQGWGEPFLNPDFFTMASIAKKEGLQIGTTTNGTLLDQEKNVRLIDAGLDILAFSLAGTNEQSNDRIRKGTRLIQVLKAIEILENEKIKRGSRTPAIHVAYLVLRSTINEMEKLPRLLEGKGVSQVMISTLDFVASEELQSEVIRPSSEKEYLETESFFLSVAKEGERRGLPVHYYIPPVNRESRYCTENVQRAFCIAADGALTPCVFTNLPVGDEFQYLSDEKRPCQRNIMGNLQTQSPLDIWSRKPYKKFRNSFSGRDLAPVCRGCPKLGVKSPSGT